MGCRRKKSLNSLLTGLDVSCDENTGDIEVCGVTADSRQVQPGMLFVAVAGQTVDGHRFIAEAVQKGCPAVMACREADVTVDVPVVRADDTAAMLGFVAGAFYDHPCRQLRMIGITGTNGKTTSSYLLEEVIQHTGGKPGVIGTVSVRYMGHETFASLTTPQPVELQRILRKMCESGVTHVVMEVSSHALEQQRVNGIWFDVVLFTNLSRDHLDYHGTMERYFAQKEKLFSLHLKEKGKGVIVLSQNDSQGEANVEWSQRLVQLLTKNNRRFWTCGIGKGLVQARNFKSDLGGIKADIITPEEQCHLTSKLVGRFNLKNLLGTIGCAEALGLDLDTICRGLRRADGVPGRMERIFLQKNDGKSEADVDVFVDYAHTPDALENVLRTLKELNPVRLVVVFGCGGDRDQGKRSLMGEVAARLADVVILTTDNSRTESPVKILAEIEQGVKKANLAKVAGEQLMESPDQNGYDIVADRAEAIRIAIRHAQPGDVVLISGKGHETYQIAGSKKEFFDDRDQARKQLEKRMKDLLLKNGECKRRQVQCEEQKTMLVTAPTGIAFCDLCSGEAG
ncbi:MAG: UDP-N-acetylmuramoyl-L-alanyl-D-glutamate--2,6-diaminopimelate ligase [Desulfobulbaceae bacterium]|nr:UDP-N-acetylmuramoyl-L-alanyl-D-glutamate--2,6-diaminopimelate ligase [Desulfobulbaceae bacterium]